MLKNTLSVHIGWGHCDPAKIVFYPNYFIWFDQSAHHLFDKAGANMGDLMDQFGVLGLPIVDAHAEFLYPSKYGDVIEVNSWISEWREKTLVATHEIYNYYSVSAPRNFQHRLLHSANILLMLNMVQT